MSRHIAKVASSASAMVLTLALASTGAAQSPSAPAGPAPAPSADPASGSPGASPGTGSEIPEDICARFVQPVPVGSVARPAAIRTLGQAQTTDPEPATCPAPAWDPTAAWPFAGAVDAAQAFHWSDGADDGSDPQGEITGVGWAPVSLSKQDAGSIVAAKAFGTNGAAAKAIKAGNYIIIQVETAEMPAPSPTRGISFHIGTDRKNDKQNNVPTSVGNPLSPWQNLQNVYSLGLAAGADTLTLAATDFAGKRNADGSSWYNDHKTLFAGRVTDSPAGVQFLIPAAAMGATFRPVSVSNAPVAGRSLLASIAGPGRAPMSAPAAEDPDSGTDWVDVAFDLGQLPVKGRVPGLLGCLDVALVHTPVTLEEVAINKRTFKMQKMPSHKELSACFQLDREGYGLVLDFTDEAGDEYYTARGSARITVYEDGTLLQEIVPLEVDVSPISGKMYFYFPEGLGHYGYHALLDMKIQGTDDADLDDLFDAAAGQLVDGLSPQQVDKEQGLIQGGGQCPRRPA